MKVICGDTHLFIQNKVCDGLVSEVSVTIGDVVDALAKKGYVVTKVDDRAPLKLGFVHAQEDEATEGR